MASGRLVNGDWMPAVDANGYPLPDAYIRVYVNRTTTLATVYSDEALTLPLTNPVLADSSGQFPYIWQDSALLFSMELGSVSRGTIATVDDVAPSSELGIINADLKQDKTFALGFTGAVARTVDQRFAERPISVYEYQNLVVGDDWTAAINAALLAKFAVYMPARTGGYYVTDQITFAPAGNMLIGDGRTVSYFRIDDAFNMDADAVVKMNSTASETGSGLQGIGWQFEQPNTSVRANMTIYPWALELANVSRCSFSDLRISGGSHGINASGNVGGSSWGGIIEVGCFVYGMALGGVLGQGASLDFTHIDTLTFWPFGLEDVNRLQVYWDGNNTALEMGAVDGLDIKSLCVFGAHVYSKFTPAFSRGPIGNIAIFQMDSRYNCFFMEEGRLAVASFYGSSEISDDRKIYKTGGHLELGPHFLLPPAGGTAPFVENAGGSFIALAGYAANASPTAPIYRGSGGQTDVTHTHFLVGTNQARSIGFVDQTGGPCNFSNNYFPPVGTGSGPAASFATDDVNRCADNVVSTPGSAVQWTVKMPPMSGGLKVGIYGPNTGYKTLSIVAAGTLPVLPNYDSYAVAPGAGIGNITPTYDGHEITLLMDGPGTMFAGGSSIFLSQGENFVYEAGDIIGFVLKAGQWRERFRTRKNPYNRPPRTVALADPLTPVLTDSVINVNGSGGAVGTIAPTQDGHRILLRFNGATTVNGNSSTIKLKGLANLVTANRTTLDLLCTGSEWVQVGGEVNS